MPYAIVLYFNEPSENAIKEIWDKLSQKNLSANISEAGIRPHLTLAIYDELHCQSCEKELEKFSAHTACLNISAEHFGIFFQPETILFLAPTPTRELLDFQAGIHKCLASKTTNPWPMYQPGIWVPHCTIAMNLEKEQLLQAVASVADVRLPIELHATQIGAVEFLPIDELFKYNLKNE